MEYLTAKKLQQRFGLPLPDAKRIVKEQTSQAYFRHPLLITCWVVAFALILYAPSGWKATADAAALLLTLAAMSVARLLKHDAILDACRKLAPPPGTANRSMR